MNSTLKTKTFQVTLATVFLVVILALPAIACSDFIRSREEDFTYSLTSIEISKLYMYGLPLLATICIESFIFSRQKFISYHKAFLITTLANVVYFFLSLFSFVGFSTAISFANPTVFINLIGSVILAKMSLSFYGQQTGYLKYLSKRLFTLLAHLFFTSLGFAEILIFDMIKNSTEFTFLYAGMAGILLIRFIINFVIKGYTLSIIFKLIFKKKIPSLADTVLSMHVSSYPIIAMAYYLWSLQGFN